jgi:hypothetical protein
MKTRSQDELFVDFDEASEEWMKNKKKIGNGTYQYIDICRCKISLRVACENVDGHCQQCKRCKKNKF